MPLEAATNPQKKKTVTNVGNAPLLIACVVFSMAEGISNGSISTWVAKLISTVDMLIGRKTSCLTDRNSQLFLQHL